MNPEQASKGLGQHKQTEGVESPKKFLPINTPSIENERQIAVLKRVFEEAVKFSSEV